MLMNNTNIKKNKIKGLNVSRYYKMIYGILSITWNIRYAGMIQIITTLTIPS